MNNEGNLLLKKRKTPENRAGYDLDKRTNGVFALMKKFLMTYANDIQKKATEHHKEYLGGGNFRSEFIDKYQKNHIDLTEQKKIFEEFYRVSDKETKTFSGMGMGLFIANEIIKRHGSNINVLSQKGKGSKFYFTLPQA